MTDTTCTVYGGKGGVGKTTCAAASALRAAESGERTLVVSTDPAHSLADAFETPLDADPSEIRPNLWAVEIDPEARAERYEAIARALAADLRSAGVALSDEEVARLFASGAPAGSDEVAALDLLVEYVDGAAGESGDRKREWDRVVFDTAPTGHTLRLLELPDVMGLALGTLGSLRGQVRRIGDSAKRVVLGPMYYATGRSNDEDGLAELQARLERARELLTDPDRTEFRVVTLPETMAIAESERLVGRLREASVPVGTVVVNRVLEPGDVDSDCARCRSRSRRHRDRVAEIRETFPDLEVVVLPEAEGEVHGMETLAAVADRLPD